MATAANCGTFARIAYDAACAPSYALPKGSLRIKRRVLMVSDLPSVNLLYASACRSLPVLAMSQPSP